MTNKELQAFLAKFPDETPIKLLVKAEIHQTPIELTSDHVMLSSETAYIDEEAPEHEWDCEDGKFKLGRGKRYLLFNPVIQ